MAPRSRLLTYRHILAGLIGTAVVGITIAIILRSSKPLFPIPSAATTPDVDILSSGTLTSTLTPILSDALTAAPAHPLGSTWIRKVDNATMVFVPAGEFRMGSTGEEIEYALQLREQYRAGCQCTRRWAEDEQPVRIVTLVAFWLDRTEVTKEQYRLCVADLACNPSEYDKKYEYKNDRHPMVGVSWEDATRYCKWAGTRLPTEAEWEYATRGPERRTYPWGNRFDGTRCNYCDEECEREWADRSLNDGYAITAPVGSYPSGASWCGALDLSGNVWEWVADKYGSYPPEQQVNPTGSLAGIFRVLRGGSWSNLPYFLRGADRNWTNPAHSDTDIGFRCARSCQ